MITDSNEPIFPADPRLTAYALGELEGADLAQIAAAIAADPALQTTVAALRALEAELQSALASEARLGDATVVASSPTPVTARRRWGKLIPFSLGIAASLAAASLAVVVWVNPHSTTHTVLVSAPAHTKSQASPRMVRSGADGAGQSGVFTLASTPLPLSELHSRSSETFCADAVDTVIERSCRIAWQPAADRFPRWTGDNGFRGLMQVVAAQRVRLHPLMIPRYELVVATEDFSRVVRVFFAQPLNVGAGYAGPLGTLTGPELARLQALGNGHFYAALFVDGLRCSNVAAFSIEPSADRSDSLRAKEFVQMTGIDSGGDGVITHLAVQARVTQQRTEDGRLLLSAPIIDGVARTASSGAVRVSVRTDGTSENFLVTLADFAPPVVEQREHRIELQLGPLKSGETTVRTDHVLTQKFDAAVAPIP